MRGEPSLGLNADASRRRTLLPPPVGLPFNELYAASSAAIRIAANLSQAELAARANLPVEEILDLEQGKRQSIVNLSAISFALNLSLEALFEGRTVSEARLREVTRR